MRCSIASFAAFAGFVFDAIIMAVILAIFGAAALCLTSAIGAESFATFCAFVFGTVCFFAVGHIFGIEAAKAATVREARARARRVYI